MCTSTSLSDPKFIYVSKVQYSLGHISMCPHFYVPSSLCAPHLYIPPSLCVPRHLYLPPYLFILADGVKRGAYLCAPISMCPQFFLPSFLCALIFYMLPSLCVSWHLYLLPNLFMLADGVKRGVHLCAPMSMCLYFSVTSSLCPVMSSLCALISMWPHFYVSLHIFIRPQIYLYFKGTVFFRSPSLCATISMCPRLYVPTISICLLFYVSLNIFICPWIYLYWLMVSKGVHN